MPCLHRVPEIVEKIREYQMLLESKQLRIGDKDRVPELLGVIRKNIDVNDLVSALKNVEEDDISIEENLASLSKDLVPYELPRGLTSSEIVITNALIERPDLVHDFFSNTHSCLILLSLINTMMYRAIHGIRSGKDIFDSIISVGCCGAKNCTLKGNKLQDYIE